jgi:acyl dehydratase
MEPMKAQAAPLAYRMKTLDQFVGKQVGLSDWIVVDQRRIDEFAECTGDRQWIHVDAERAKRETPYGGTIAHGYLTLSLAASLTIEGGAIPRDAAAALNYGLENARFIAPVRAGARVRNRVVLKGLEDRGDGRILLTLLNTIEIDGEPKPALVAETLALLMGTPRVDTSAQP